uniref:Uncharacterized protein n=1 Tax=Myoviridae sp. ctHMa1 TaxID=2827671 RepID=A0A8S5SGZ5_9CAUD|nr:MAG TPA: hypothetical protein [Myoviridae sp. ctHMa1]
MLQKTVHRPKRYTCVRNMSVSFFIGGITGWMKDGS